LTSVRIRICSVNVIIIFIDTKNEIDIKQEDILE
jgi:hypothetical protein